MFLMELSRLGAPYILGSQASRAGISQVLLDIEPGILLVDEIDRIGSKDISVLLSLMATGIVSETKWGRKREVRLDTRVFAAANTTKLPPELLSRFMVLEFKPYSLDDFMEVAVSIMVREERVERDLGTYIARRVWQEATRFPDPRQAVRIARLAASKEEVDRVFDLLKRYGR
jgi:Holliday junction DNA helicase RuvB